jgi:hypothetical protein
MEPYYEAQNHNDSMYNSPFDEEPLTLTQESIRENELVKQQFLSRKIFKQELKLRRTNFKMESKREKSPQQEVKEERRGRNITQVSNRSYAEKKQLSFSQYEFVAPIASLKMRFQKNLTPTQGEHTKRRTKTNRSVDEGHLFKNELISNSHRFWKLRGCSWDHRSHARPMTEACVPKTENCLAVLTQYSPTANRKAIHLLALQLQINLDCEKHTRVLPAK